MSNEKDKLRKNPLTGTLTQVIETPYSKDGWRIVECQETGMVYLENPPEYSALSEEFAWEKTFEEEKKRRKKEEPVWSRLSSLAKRARKIVRRRERIITEALRAIHSIKQTRNDNSPIRMVDVGCGDGDKSLLIANELKTSETEIDRRPIGIEVSIALSKATQEKLQPLGGYCVTNNALDGLASLDPNSAEIVILCSFLEHEVNPLQLLEEVKRVLAPDGVCIIKVPNYSCLGRRVRQKRWCGFRYPDHVNYFVPKTLKAMILKSGMKIKRMNFLDTIPTGDNMWVVASK